jgi:hypothetical protein
MNQDISDKITGSIISADRNAVEVIGDVSEFTIDQILSDGLLKEIPWVGWISKGISLWNTIGDRILIGKIAMFLFKLESLSKIEKEQFTERLKKDKEYRKKVGTKLLLTLDKLDDLSKCDFLAAVFDHYITKDIDYKEFDRLAHSIQQAHTADLASLLEGSRINFEGLLNSGLSQVARKITFQPRAGETEIELSLELSKIGDLLKSIMNDRLRKQKGQAQKLLKLFFE